MSKSADEARLVDALDRLGGLRARALHDADYSPRRDALRQWQAARLARTHADLLASPRFHDAAQFFLSDLYGPQDVSVHADAVRRILPVMTRTLPPAALDTVADAMELDALSEEFDSAMVDALGARTRAIDAASYAAAYRRVGRQAERARQIELIAHLGRSLDGLTRHPFIGAALKMMKRPAVVAGLGALQSFLERGYSAFRKMSGGSEFVEMIAARERALSLALFAGDDSGLT